MSLTVETLKLSENEIAFLTSLNEALIRATYDWTLPPENSMLGSLVDQLGGQDDELGLFAIPGFNKKNEFFNSIRNSISPKADQKIMIDNLMELHLLSTMEGHGTMVTYSQILAKICISYKDFYYRNYKEESTAIRCPQKFIELLGTETTIEAFIEALETAQI